MVGHGRMCDLPAEFRLPPLQAGTEAIGWMCSRQPQGPLCHIRPCCSCAGRVEGRQAAELRGRRQDVTWPWPGGFLQRDMGHL